MDKIFSTRVDENTIHKIAMISKELKISKKAVIEEAITLFIQKRQEGKDVDALKKTLGAWRRSEGPDVTVKKARDTFNKSMQRHQS
jgi:predicted transcriptional regulator